MTWEELKAHIEVMDPEQIKTDVTVCLWPDEEFFKVEDINFVLEECDCPGAGVLDDNHPFLEVHL